MQAVRPICSLLRPGQAVAESVPNHSAAQSVSGAGSAISIRNAGREAGFPCRSCHVAGRVASFLRGHRLSRRHCRPLGEWVTLLQSLGFEVEPHLMSGGKPFANTVQVCRVPV